MSTRTVLITLFVLLPLAAGMLSACGGTAPEPLTTPTQTDQPAANGATLLQDRCTGCHSLNRVTSAQMTQEEWADIVARMVNKGAPLNEAEQAILVNYLAQTYGP